MTVLFYLLLLPAAVLAAPVYVLLRSCYGWRFGLVLLLAWIVAFAVLPGGPEVVEWMTGKRLPVPSLRPNWGLVNQWLAANAGFVLRFDAVGFAMLAGVVAWPLHLLAMLVARFNEVPPGSIGIGLSARGMLKLALLAGLVAAAGFVMPEFRDIAHSGATVLVSLAAAVLLVGMGGNHNRMLMLDKSLGLSFRRKGTGDPLANPSRVGHAGRFPATGSGGLDGIFAARPPELAGIIRN